MRCPYFIVLTILFLTSCNSEPKIDESAQLSDQDSLGLEDIDTSINEVIISEYDMSKVDKKDLKEFKQNLVKIEKKYGEQWDFCACAVKQDSVNKAFQKSNMSDEEFDRVLARSDEIDQKCQAFLVQNPNVTPEERANHERQVKKCLKEAGVK